MEAPIRLSATPYKMTTARRMEDIPEGVAPQRHAGAGGYIFLIWKIGIRQYVRAPEHRYVMGFPAGKQVHHVNEDVTDNRPENLRVVTPREHRQIHGKVDMPLVVRLYENGYTTVQIGKVLGVHSSQIFRRLRAAGVVLRSHGESRKLSNLMREELAA